MSFVCDVSGMLNLYSQSHLVCIVAVGSRYFDLYSQGFWLGVIKKCARSPKVVSDGAGFNLRSDTKAQPLNFLRMKSLQFRL